jgi:arylsulfatase A-like enzyme
VKRRKLQSDPVYAAMVEVLDRNVGKVIRKLEDEGLFDDTLIVFTSDNGGLATKEGSPTCNAPLAEGKGWMYEGGTREPLIVSWPNGGVPRHAATDAVTTSTDFYPTFLEVAGVEPIPTQHPDGVSILPVFQGARDFERGPIYWHFPHYGNQGGRPGCSIREGDWKLIEFFEDNRLELYNLREDIGEETDRAEAEPALRDDLHRKLKAWREEVGALIPQKNPHWPDGP